MIGINYGVYSIKDIVKELQKMNESKEGGNNVKKDNVALETSIRKRFTYILGEKLKLSQEEIGWFKEKLDNGREQFIFQAGKYTLMYLEDILDICGRKNVAITPSEERNLIEAFTRILPYPILEGNVEACASVFNMRANRIEQAVCDLYRSSQEINLYEKDLFVKIDAKLESDRKKRQAFYKDQYVRIKNWREKWIFVMDMADGIRKAERIECLYLCKNDNINECTKEDEENFYKTGKSENEKIQKAYEEIRKISEKDLCQYVLWLFITRYQMEKRTDEEKLTDKATQADIRNRDGCIEACTLEFSKVITHQLKDDSMKDFEYMIKEAIKELEIIKKILRQDYIADGQRKKALYPEIEILRHKDRLSKMKICTEKDLQHLSNIRRYLNEKENERILVIDYIGQLTE